MEEGDEGLYTCNLHHHYCHLYESLAVRLEVTDDREWALRAPPRPSRRRTLTVPSPPQPKPHARTGTARRRCWRRCAARPRC